LLEQKKHFFGQSRRHEKHDRGGLHFRNSNGKMKIGGVAGKVTRRFRERMAHAEAESKFGEI
jgi:hypothetical protein